MPNFPINNVLNFPLNRLGRDFVVGDLCGEYELLLWQLKTLKFDATKDRLFHLGHLVGGGGSMTQCVRFLRQPGIFALRTNTEQQLLDLFDEGEPDEAAWASVAEAHGEAGAWLAEAGRAQRHQVVEAMRMLPLAIGIGDRTTAVGLVHGAVPAGLSWREFTTSLLRADAECTSAALWGSQEIPKAPVSEVEEVFVCYTPAWNLGYAGLNVRQVMPGHTVQMLKQGMANADLSKKGPQ